MNIDINDGLYSDLASVFFFNRLMTPSQIDRQLKKYNVTFRKNKSMDDVLKAVSKAIKNGKHATEYELSYLAVYLKGIFKVVR